MTLSVVRSRALVGLRASPISVEVHLANGLPAFNLVGLADVEVKEARERVRAALLTCGLEFPHNKRITVNLAPADLPKGSGRFDLPIALGILAAMGQLDGAALAGFEFMGELSLSGELRPVRGALAISLALRAEGAGAALVLPPGSAEEAALVPGVGIWRAAHLLDVVRRFTRRPPSKTPPTRAHPPPTGEPEETEGWSRGRPLPAVPTADGPDLRDVKGQAAARRALEIAAAGGHSLLLVGPPGAGKSMLAQRLSGLLPPMELVQALEAAAVASLAGRFVAAQWSQRPTRSPHHSASPVALVGGGSPPRPGEISLAHHGVLFLDELPEFPRAALEALREPLETGSVTIARAARTEQFPARFQLVAAMNPCPCGWLGSVKPACRCSPEQVARYQGRISGPLLDRIDLQVHVLALPSRELLQGASGEDTATVRARSSAARERALQRQGVPNHALAGPGLDQHASLDSAAREFLQTAATRLGWSGRATHRVIRVARTIADLEDSRGINTAHVAEGMQYRRGLAS
jgi:magnesium chelatase family protein